METRLPLRSALSSLQRVSISTLRPTPQPNSCTSTALAAGTVAVLELASFVSGFGSVAEFSTSKVGVIHSDDTTPTDITDGTLSPAVPVKSLYQPVAEPRLQYSMTRQSKSVALSSKSTGERRSCP